MQVLLDKLSSNGELCPIHQLTYSEHLEVIADWSRIPGSDTTQGCVVMQCKEFVMHTDIEAVYFTVSATAYNLCCQNKMMPHGSCTRRLVIACKIFRKLC